MNDEKLEQHLRELPAPELPESWRAEILANAVRSTRRVDPKRQAWPAILLYLRNLWVRNPITASALAMLWILIFTFKATTPIDPQEKMLLAHFDPKRPVHIVSISDQILLAQLAMDQSDSRSFPQMP
jgi:hypothetical protein